MTGTGIQPGIQTDSETETATGTGEALAGPMVTESVETWKPTEGMLYDRRVSSHPPLLSSLCAVCVCASFLLSSLLF